MLGATEGDERRELLLAARVLRPSRVWRAPDPQLPRAVDQVGGDERRFARSLSEGR